MAALNESDRRSAPSEDELAYDPTEALPDMSIPDTADTLMMEPDERHLVKVSTNGKPAPSAGTTRGAFSGRGAFTRRTAGFSGRRR